MVGGGRVVGAEKSAGSTRRFLPKSNYQARKSLLFQHVSPLQRAHKINPFFLKTENKFQNFRIGVTKFYLVRYDRKIAKFETQNLAETAKKNLKILIIHRFDRIVFHLAKPSKG